MDQKEIFLSAEGDAWFERNKAKLGQVNRNPVLNSLESMKVKPSCVLEIGCSNGYRLAELRKRFDCEAHGIEPSKNAVDDAKRFPEISVRQGTADAIPHPAGKFDLVIFGFCLYLCDPKDFFSIAREADRVLRNRGFLAILDFLPPRPYKNKYTHHSDVFSHKMEWQKMFTWNPAYSLLQRQYTSDTIAEDDRVCVDLLYKNEESAFPTRD